MSVAVEPIDRRTASGDDYAIELRDIVKRFPGVVANDGVNLKVRRGTIHAIVGENGAGKSTLMKTLYGAHQPDEGTILVDGEVQHFRSPAAAIRHGIGMVFQHFMLADNFTVWENIVLGSEPGWPVLARNAARRRIRALGSRYGLEVDPDELVSDLGVGEKQRVEILKVLYRGAEILILDEPTAVLVPHEVDELFASLRELTASKATVIFISHKLDEVLEYADAITVIRAGKTVGEVDDPSSVTAEQLAEMMVGSELPSPETRESTVTDRVLLEVVDLAVEPDARVGEVTLGITSSADLFTGAPGAVGPSPTARRGVDRGPRRRDRRHRRRRGQRPVRADRRHRRPGLGHRHGPPRRHRHQHALDARPAHRRDRPDPRGPPPSTGWSWPCRCGRTCCSATRPAASSPSRGLIDRDACRRRADEVVRGFDVRTPSIDVRAFTLSGGNQQKLIVGREMLAKPTVLIAAHPTRGVDVGAQAVIWDILRDARAAGLATLLISADLEELIGLSDRLLVMLRGRIVADLDPATVEPGRPRRLHDRRTHAGAATEADVSRKLLYGVAAPVLAAVVAVAVSSIALLIAGESPRTAFLEMWKSIDSTASVVAIVNRAVPYYVAGVAVAIGFIMRLFNIGVDGQHQLAALFAAAFGFGIGSWGLPAPLYVASIFLVAVLVAMAWASIAAVLKVTRNVNEVISTIMLNFIASQLIFYLLRNYWNREHGSGRRDRTAAKRRHGSPTSTAVRGDRVPLPGQRHPPGVPADRHRRRHRLPRRAQPQPLRLRPAGVRPEPGGGQGIRHQPEAHGAADVPDLRWHRRIDRPRPAARRPAVRQVRRPVPPGPRVHRAVACAARAQPSGRHRRRRPRVGDDRAGDAAPQLHRHPPGDRHHPAGFVPARRRRRLRGRAPQGRGGRDEGDGPAHADADRAGAAPVAPPDALGATT